MTSKQRSKLRSKAVLADTILIIGKGGINEEICKQASDAINARELIKCKVLETAPLDALEAGNYIADKIEAILICNIGSKFVLYKKNNKLKTKHVANNTVKTEKFDKIKSNYYLGKYKFKNKKGYNKVKIMEKN